MKEFFSYILNKILNKKIVKFGILGSIVIITNLVIFFIFVDKLGFNKDIIATIAFFIAITQNYFLNYILISKNKTKDTKINFYGWLKFTLFFLLGLGINLFILNIILQFFLDLPYKVIGQAFGIVGGMLFNSIMSKYFVFRKNPQSGWFYGYKNLESIKKECSGYDCDIILEKCKNSLLKVKSGEAVYERDSVLFDKIEYSFPLLSSLLYVAAKNENKLYLIDFGGSLGSSYFQNRLILDLLKEIKWGIVEQPKFVETGKKYFEDNILKFYYTIDHVFKDYIPDLIIFSSVLQYIDDPFNFIKNIINYNFKYIFIDLTGFAEVDEHIITKQIVPESIYKASYPCWFFNEEKFIKLFNDKYKIIYDFDCEICRNIEIYNVDIYNIKKKRIVKAKYRGFFLELKKNLNL